MISYIRHQKHNKLITEKADKLNFSKLKSSSFFSPKDTVKKMKRQAIDWEEMFIKHVSDRGLVSRIY